jgi:hypothetical protein
VAVRVSEEHKQKARFTKLAKRLRSIFVDKLMVSLHATPSIFGYLPMN